MNWLNLFLLAMTNLPDSCIILSSDIYVVINYWKILDSSMILVCGILQIIIGSLQYSTRNNNVFKYFV